MFAVLRAAGEFLQGLRHRTPFPSSSRTRGSKVYKAMDLPQGHFRLSPICIGTISFRLRYMYSINSIVNCIVRFPAKKNSFKFKIERYRIINMHYQSLCEVKPVNKPALERWN